MAVLETGCGGTYDVTNLVTPEISVITSIGMDHAAILGGTLENIAINKAGIIKPGVPVVVGPHCDPKEVFIKRADELKSYIILMDAPKNWWDFTTINN